jgi:hypothetical protein
MFVSRTFESVVAKLCNKYALPPCRAERDGVFEDCQCCEIVVKGMVIEARYFFDGDHLSSPMFDEDVLTLSLCSKSDYEYFGYSEHLVEFPFLPENGELRGNWELHFTKEKDLQRSLDRFEIELERLIVYYLKH